MAALTISTSAGLSQGAVAAMTAYSSEVRGIPPRIAFTTPKRVFMSLIVGLNFFIRHHGICAMTRCIICLLGQAEANCATGCGKIPARLLMFKQSYTTDENLNKNILQFH